MNMQETKPISAYKQGLRSKIIETALKAFRARGIRAVTMDDVATELGISKRTLYEIFDKKEDLLYEGVKTYLGERRNQMEIRAGQCSNVMEIILQTYKLKVDEVRQVNPTFYEDILKYPKVEEFIRTAHENSREEFLNFMQRGVNEGLFRKDINHVLIAQQMDAMSKYINQYNLWQKYSFSELFANFYLVSLRGLCTERGVKVLDKAMAKIQ
jgi:AcrR family transcriptional regulator